MNDVNGKYLQVWYICICSLPLMINEQLRRRWHDVLHSHYHALNLWTRWYPWGIQPLVSTYCNRHWQFGGGGVLESQNPKCQDLPKFQFLRGGGGCVCVCVLEPNLRTGVFWRIWSKISGSLACWCVADGLSHTTYVKTNKGKPVDIVQAIDSFVAWLCHVCWDLERKRTCNITSYIDDTCK